MVKLSLVNEENGVKSYYWLKTLILTAVIAILGSILGFSIAKIFSHENVFGLSGYYSMAISVLLFVSLFSLESIFGENSRVLYAVAEAVFVMAGYLLGRGGSSIGLGELILLGVLIGFFIWGRLAIFKSEEETMKIHIQKIIKRGVSLVLTGLILFWSIGFGLTIWENPNNGFFISSKGLEKVLNSSNFLVHFYLPNFAWSMTVDEFMNDLSEKTVDSAIEKTFGTKIQQETSGNIDVINKQKEVLMSESASTLRQKFSEILNSPLTGKETLAETAYQWLFGKFQSIPQNMRDYLLVALMLVLFITLKIFAPLISLVIRFFTFLIYEIFMALGFANMSYEAKSKENVIIP
ncbi:MAG TPA: hypothetical protein PLQ44_00595 [Candidatus Paceibacterota bacterium]|nr:hypothetical protein [Candidatus Paceibacterota bacterium]HPT40092.1 hypothetical protein [Candidatus Paceibacterota bacterium]